MHVCFVCVNACAYVRSTRLHYYLCISYPTYSSASDLLQYTFIVGIIIKPKQVRKMTQNIEQTVKVYFQAKSQ